VLSQKIKEFNEHLIKSKNLQVKLKTITSPIELVKIAKEEGFELSIEDFKELANHAYQEWLNQLNETTRLFFAKVHLSPELNQRLYECNSKKDIIDLAHQCGVNLLESNINLAAEIAQSVQGFSFEKIFFSKIS
jgi:predicted ribosomally synthesized peptide with nif11-like leader